MIGLAHPNEDCILDKLDQRGIMQSPGMDRHMFGSEV